MIELINWILEEGRDSDDLGAILEGMSERLVAQGIPVRRTNLEHADHRSHGGGAELSLVARRGTDEPDAAPEDVRGTAFQRSPIRHLLDHGIRNERWKLEDPDEVRKFADFASCALSA